jgi:hypothetical protein
MILMCWNGTGGRALLQHGGHARDLDMDDNAQHYAGLGWDLRDATGVFVPPLATIEDDRFPASAADFDAAYPGHAYVPLPPGARDALSGVADGPA